MVIILKEIKDASRESTNARFVLLSIDNSRRYDHIIPSHDNLSVDDKV